MSQKKITNDQQIYAKMFSVTNPQRNANQKHKMAPLTPVKMQLIPCTGKEKREHWYIISKNANLHAHYGKNYGGVSENEKQMQQSHYWVDF